MSVLSDKVLKVFSEKWSSKPDVLSRAPGRVNLIGEHTDYTGGFVLPVAIDREIVFAAKKNDSGEIKGYSIDFEEEASCQVGSYDPEHPSGWFRYIMGVLSELESIGETVEGFTFVMGGDIPIGAGLSSSAALETVTLTAMETLFGFKLEDPDAALLCQRAENNFVGMNCGIMDQFISRMGVEGHALLVDCDSLARRPVKINLPGYTWIIIDSKKRRGLVDSEYNNRRRECEEALETAQSTILNREINGLRDVFTDDFDILKDACDATVFARMKHVVTENDRVESTVYALEKGDAAAIGSLLFEAHASLRDDFEVSCIELDTLVGILSGIDGVAGARLTGAGFGGCVIALAHEDSLQKIEAVISKEYHPVSMPDNTHASIWPVKVSDGAGNIAISS